MSTQTIEILLAAGGQSERFGQSDTSKLLALINGKPVIWHSANALIKAGLGPDITVITHEKWQAPYQEALQGIEGATFKWVIGGATRRESINAGLNALSSENQWVLIHDAARPCVNPERIKTLIEQYTDQRAISATLASAVQDTLKRQNEGATPEIWSNQTESRKSLWAIHTPQLFNFKALKNAHLIVPNNPNLTDDTSLIESDPSLGAKTLLVTDEVSNIKITTPSDLILAETVLKAREFKA